MKYQSTARNTKSAAGRRSASRTYVSPLRVEQAAETRRRIIQAYGDEVCGGDAGDVTVQRVAARAGVSVPTLYRNFPGLDELGDAFWSSIEPEIGSYEALKTSDDLAAFTQNIMQQFAEHEPLVRAMLTTEAGRQLRAHTVRHRNQAYQRVLAPLTRKMSDRDARAITAVFKIFSSGHVWHLLHDDWGLDGSEAGRAAAWATRVLIDALRKDPRPLEKMREKGQE